MKNQRLKMIYQTPWKPILLLTDLKGVLREIHFLPQPLPSKLPLWDEVPDIEDELPETAQILKLEWDRYFENPEYRPAILWELKGTPFQMAVWAALETIPRGQVRTYSQIAQQIGRPKASRAVGTACASNPLSFLIPCHRVVPRGGGTGNYGGGKETKAALLKREGAQLEGLSLT